MCAQSEGSSFWQDNAQPVGALPGSVFRVLSVISSASVAHGLRARNPELSLIHHQLELFSIRTKLACKYSNLNETE